jgi:putative membrane protein
LENNNREKFEKNMILRDYLALDRTRLANMRTFLAYCRTAVGFFASGLGMIQLLDESLYFYMGSAFMGLSPFILIVGIVHYIRVQRRWSKLQEKNPIKYSE